ncbi:MAG: hypothetical protein N2C12_00750, partial [Planctomycetales bacterium]
MKKNSLKLERCASHRSAGSIVVLLTSLGAKLSAPVNKFDRELSYDWLTSLGGWEHLFPSSQLDNLEQTKPDRWAMLCCFFVSLSLDSPTIRLE